MHVMKDGDTFNASYNILEQKKRSTKDVQSVLFLRKLAVRQLKRALVANFKTGKNGIIRNMN